jgi:hypothetical protein
VAILTKNVQPVINRKTPLGTRMKPTLFNILTKLGWHKLYSVYLFACVRRCFLKFGVEVGVEESIVNEPLVLKTLIFQIKNTNNAKSEVSFKQLINHSS